MPAGQGTVLAASSSRGERPAFTSSTVPRTPWNLEYFTSLGQERPNLSRLGQYLEVRDSLLPEQPHRYAAVAYLDQLMTDALL